MQRPLKLHGNASVHKEDHARHQVCQPHKVHFPEQELEQGVHGPQPEHIHFSPEDRPAHVPGLGEENHGQAMTQHGHAVQKRQLFEVPVRQGVELHDHKFDGRKAHQKLHGVGDEPAHKCQGILKAGLDGKPDGHGCHRPVMF